MELVIKKEIIIAKRAAIEAGNILLNDKARLIEILSSTNKDIKLKADISA